MRSLIVSVLVGFWSFTAVAKDGSSGCGPGWFILKDNSLVSSFLRNITHGFSSPVVTLGMTFGTSECAKHKIVDQNKRSEHFATVGFEKLRQDAAKGQGLFVDAYARTFQCDSHGAALFKTRLQQQYGEVFAPGATPGEIVDRTRSVVRSDAKVREHCTAA